MTLTWYRHFQRNDGLNQRNDLDLVQAFPKKWWVRNDPDLLKAFLKKWWVESENRNDPDLVQVFLNKWWVESEYNDHPRPDIRTRSSFVSIT